MRNSRSSGQDFAAALLGLLNHRSSSATRKPSWLTAFLASLIGRPVVEVKASVVNSDLAEVLKEEDSDSANPPSSDLDSNMARERLLDRDERLAALVRRQGTTGRATIDMLKFLYDALSAELLLDHRNGLLHDKVKAAHSIDLGPQLQEVAAEETIREAATRAVVWFVQRGILGGAWQRQDGRTLREGLYTPGLLIYAEAYLRSLVEQSATPNSQQGTLESELREYRSRR